MCYFGDIVAGESISQVSDTQITHKVAYEKGRT